MLVTEITAKSIDDALRKQLDVAATPASSTREVGTVIQIGDGIARVDGLKRRHGRRAPRVRRPGRQDRLRSGPEPRRRRSRRRASRRCHRNQGERPGSHHRPHRGSSLGQGDARPRGEPARHAHRRQGPHRGRGHTAPSSSRLPALSPASRCTSPLQTGILAIDAMVPIGRGQRELIIGDRQTGKTAIARGYHHQPEGQGHDLHLRGHRPEGLHGRRASGETLEKHGAMDYTIIVSASASDSAPLQYIAPMRRCGHGRVLHVQRRGRPAGLRRQPRSATCCASTTTCPSRPWPTGQMSLTAAPSPGTRGLPRRRLLPALPSAGARRQAHRRERRRLAYGAAHHRDPGRRRLGLHPDQRHLHHRRPDLPADRPVLPGPAPGRQRGPVGFASRRLRPDQGYEASSPATLRLDLAAVSASCRRSRSSAATWTRRPSDQLNRGAHMTELLKQGRYNPMAGRGAGGVHLCGRPAATSTTCPVGDVVRFRGELLDYVQRLQRRRSFENIAKAAEVYRRDRSRAERMAIEAYQADVHRLRQGR